MCPHLWGQPLWAKLWLLRRKPASEREAARCWEALVSGSAAVASDSGTGRHARPSPVCKRRCESVSRLLKVRWENWGSDSGLSDFQEFAHAVSCHKHTLFRQER